MNISQFIAHLEKLLQFRLPFGFEINSKGDGKFKIGSIKGEEVINKLLTDKKD